MSRLWCQQRYGDGLSRGSLGERESGAVVAVCADIDGPRTSNLTRTDATEREIIALLKETIDGLESTIRELNKER